MRLGGVQGAIRIDNQTTAHTEWKEQYTDVVTMASCFYFLEM